MCVTMSTNRVRCRMNWQRFVPSYLTSKETFLNSQCCVALLAKQKSSAVLYTCLAVFITITISTTTIIEG